MSKKKIKPPKTDEQYAASYDPKMLADFLNLSGLIVGAMPLGFTFMLIESVAVVGGPYLISLAIDDGIAVGNVVALRNAVLVVFVVGLAAVGHDLYAGQCDGSCWAVGDL